MGKYVGWIKGIKKPLDFVFKKCSHTRGVYHFYLGQYHIATIHAMYARNNKTVRYWTVIVKGDLADSHSRLAKGFKTRFDAAYHALKLHELTRYES